MSAASSPARRRVAAGLFVLAALASLRLSPAVACPFCGTVGESIARKRAGAAAVCIAEAVGPAARDTSGLLAVPFRVLHTLQGTLPDGIPATLEARVAAPVAGTAVLFVSRDDPPRYSALAAEETVAWLEGTRGALRGPAGPEDTRVARPADLAVLVGSHREAAAVREALAAVGVPAVAASRDSVFDTEAAQWLAAWLDAVAGGGSDRAARSAAVTPLCGWTADELAWAQRVLWGREETP